MTEATHFPTLTRRQLCRAGMVSITGGALAPMVGPLKASAAGNADVRGGAKCVVVLNLVGGPSQMDTFDVKEYPTTPDDVDIRTTSLGYRWPYGLLPKTAGILDELCVVRSMGAWETFHNLAQYNMQTGHPFNASRAREIPSIGSVIAYELLSEAQDSDFLPPFISMNFPAGAVNGTLVREGFLPSSAAPLTLDMRSGGNMPFFIDRDEVPRFNRRLDFLRTFDSSRHLEGSGASKMFSEWDYFATSAERMIKSPGMARIVELSEPDRKRYGGSALGDACIIARNMVTARAGARYILVNQGGWDHHGDIYGKQESIMEDPRQRGGLYKNCGDLDPALASLVSDLKETKDDDGVPMLDKTLVMALGEFGRTPGELTDILGRDHWPNVRCGAFAGAGVKGGRLIGATDDQGGSVTDFGWHKNRLIYPEDVTATIYSVLGIDWTKKLSGAPSGRDFQYVEPMSGTDFIGSTEVKELFS
ncbi:MAG: DUF1501 domain-containing protein [Bryobacterales bacterium]|nr:DUF1501 domain-containing protein [Bryobacterales bacterium]